MKTKITTAIIASAMLSLTGCATILNDDTQKVNISTSNGKPAAVSVDGKTVRIPATVEIKRKKEGVTIKPLNNKCAPKAINSSVDSKFFINLLSGGAFGSTTDYATGKMWKYQDDVTINCRN